MVGATGAYAVGLTRARAGYDWAMVEPLVGSVATQASALGGWSGSAGVGWRRGSPNAGRPPRLSLFGVARA